MLWWMLALACEPPEPHSCTPIVEPSRLAPPPRREPPEDLPSNVLVLLLDDVGTDQISAYGEHPEAPQTPNIDALAADGVLFRNAYAHSSCSPTRASLLSGRYASRTGASTNYHSSRADAFSTNELLIPEMLRDFAPHRWSRSAIGKWHLAGLRSEDPLSHPLVQGFEVHKGAQGNLVEAIEPENKPLGYTRWERVVNGRSELQRCYATTVQVDDALGEIAAMPEPWFLWLAPNAPHSPWHAPPRELIGETVDPDAPIPDRFAAAVRAVDAELGRLLSSMDPEVRSRTTVVLLGDNGTPEDAVRPPREPDHAKLTLYEGGINVPMIVTGPLVTAPGTESGALVQVEDLFPTVAEIAGVDPAVLRREDGSPATLDGHSLLPLLRDPDAPWPRTFAMAEDFSPPGHPPHRVVRRAVRDATHKLVYRNFEGEISFELYDLRDRFDDGPDLLASSDTLDDDASRALVRLMAALETFDEIPYEGP